MMKNTILASVLDEVFEESSNEFMRSAEPQNDHVFSDKFNKKIRRIIKTRTNPLRLFYIERHVLVNVLSVAAMIAIIAAVGILNLSNIENHGGTGGNYIDHNKDYSILDSSLAEQIEHSAIPLNTVVTDYKYDYYNDYYDYYTITDKYIYIAGLGHTGDNYSKYNKNDYKIDLQTGEMIPLCSIPNCAHMSFDAECESFMPMASADGKIFSTHEKKSITYSRRIIDENGEVLFENNYTNDFYEEFNREDYLKYKDDYRYHISNFIIDEENIYIIGLNYVYAVDKETKQTTEPVIISDGLACELMGADMENKALYFNDEAWQIFKVDLKTWEVKKISEGNQLWFHQYGGKLYYIRWLPQDPDDYSWAKAELYESDLDLGNEKLLITGCSAAFAVKDGKIFYHDVDSEALRCYDMESGDDTFLFDGWKHCYRLSTADHIDRIFAVGEDENTDSVLVSVRTDGSDLWAVTVGGEATLY